jgi:hypothetical protein
MITFEQFSIGVGAVLLFLMLPAISSERKRR